MTAILKSSELIPVEEYLEGELLSEVRHEFVSGYVYAMAGASDEHNRIAGNIFAFLHAALRGKRCEAFTNDMKVKLSPQIGDVYYYPDVLVACDPTDKSRYFRERPTVIIEVISPETERIDRREKAQAYRTIPTVQACVLVEQDRMRFTVLRPVGNQDWQTETVEGRDAVLRLPEIGVEIPCERIYERTALVDRPE